MQLGVQRKFVSEFRSICCCEFYIVFEMLYIYGVAQKGTICQPKRRQIFCMVVTSLRLIGTLVITLRFTDESCDQRILKSSTIWRSLEQEYSGTFFSTHANSSFFAPRCRIRKCKPSPRLVIYRTLTSNILFHFVS